MLIEYVDKKMYDTYVYSLQCNVKVHNLYCVECIFEIFEIYVGSGHEDNLRSPLSPLPILLLAPGCSWKCGGGSFNLYTANARNGGTLPTFLCRTAGTGGEARAGPRGAAHDT